MVHCMDEGLGNVTLTLQEQGMWSTDEPTIIVFTDENGAPTDACAQIGGNNLPHRGRAALPSPLVHLSQLVVYPVRSLQSWRFVVSAHPARSGSAVHLYDGNGHF